MGLSKSGGDRVLVELANGLVSRGHSVTVLISRPGKTTTFPIDKRIKIVVAERRTCIAAELLWLALSCPSSTDIVVANYYPTALSATISQLLTKSTAFYLIQGYEPEFFRYSTNRIGANLRRLSALISYSFPIRHLYVSNWLRERVGSFFRRPSLVVCNGVDRDIFTRMPKQEGHTAAVTVMFIGSRNPNKGADYVLCALNKLASKCELNVIVVSHDNQYRPDLLCNCEVVAPMDDIALASFYRRADIFVFASVQEGFGLPPLEAMACGTAVVCTDCGGVREYTVDDRNCILVRTESADEIYEGITVLILDTARRKAIAAEGEKTAARFSWGRAIDKYENAFRTSRTHRVL
jgi:glycosyltransferase involved in cell wall biosynthesis